MLKNDEVICDLRPGIHDNRASSESENSSFPGRFYMYKYEEDRQSDIALSETIRLLLADGTDISLNTLYRTLQTRLADECEESGKAGIISALRELKSLMEYTTPVHNGCPQIHALQLTDVATRH